MLLPCFPRLQCSISSFTCYYLVTGSAKQLLLSDSDHNHTFILQHGSALYKWKRSITITVLMAASAAPGYWMRWCALATKKMLILQLPNISNEDVSGLTPPCHYISVHTLQQNIYLDAKVTLIL
jgi:hypothetical protein